jgi:hypothetical protein
MKEYQLKNFTNGWFVGNFEPTIFATNDFEVSVKFFEAGDREPLHKQILATELTAVISGIVQMNSKEFSVGAIIEFEPGEACEFLSVTDATLVCVKFPSIPNDKIVM